MDLKNIEFIEKNKPAIDEDIHLVNNQIKGILPDVYKEFLKIAFRQKRKTLKNNLSNYDWEKAKLVLDKYNLSESVRAEEINGDIFIELFNALYFPVKKL